MHIYEILFFQVKLTCVAVLSVNLNMSKIRQQAFGVKDETSDKDTPYVSSQSSASDTIPYADADVFYNSGEECTDHTCSFSATHPHPDSIDSEDSVSLNNLLDALDGIERCEESEEDCLNSAPSEFRINNSDSYESISQKHVVKNKCNHQIQEEVKKLSSAKSSTTKASLALTPTKVISYTHLVYIACSTHFVSDVFYLDVLLLCIIFNLSVETFLRNTNFYFIGTITHINFVYCLRTYTFLLIDCFLHTFNNVSNAIIIAETQEGKRSNQRI